MDLAVLKMKTKEKFTPVSFGDQPKKRGWLGPLVVLGLGGTVTSESFRKKQTNWFKYMKISAQLMNNNQGTPWGDCNHSPRSIRVNCIVLQSANANERNWSIKICRNKKRTVGSKNSRSKKETVDVEKLTTWRSFSFKCRTKVQQKKQGSNPRHYFGVWWKKKYYNEKTSKCCCKHRGWKKCWT